VLEKGADPAALFATGGQAVGGDDVLLPLVRAVIAENAGPVEQYRNGKSATLGFLVGQVMKKSGGQAVPQTVRELLMREPRVDDREPEALGQSLHVRIIAFSSHAATGTSHRPMSDYEIQRERIVERPVTTERVVERVADRGARVGQAFDGRLRIKDARADRQVLEQQVLARKQDARRGVAVDVDDLFVLFVARNRAAKNLGGAFSHVTVNLESASRAAGRCRAAGCQG